MDTRNFIILAENKRLVSKQLEKLNKRAIRLGLNEITWSFGPSTVNAEGKLMFPVQLTGPLSVQFENWEFIATIQHLPTGENIIRSIVQCPVPEQYRTNNSDCEHCKVSRYRKDTYLVRHIIDGSFVQVGSSCIKDFLGGSSPDNLLDRASLASQIISFVSDDNLRHSGSSSEPTYYLSSFLAKTSACISAHGWLSKSAAYDIGGISTVSRVQDILLGKSGIEVSDFDIKKAEDAINWAENLSDQEVSSSDYLYNIRAIACSGIVEWRTMGFASSIIAAFDRAEANKNLIISNHVGAIKMRTVFTLSAKTKFEYNGSYGTTHKYIFNDEFGNVIVWKASNPQDFVMGKTYAVRGTIKNHTEYKGVKQTEISRCEILSTIDD